MFQSLLAEEPTNVAGALQGLPAQSSGVLISECQESGSLGSFVLCHTATTQRDRKAKTGWRLEAAELHSETSDEAIEDLPGSTNLRTQGADDGAVVEGDRFRDQGVAFSDARGPTRPV